MADEEQVTTPEQDNDDIRAVLEKGWDEMEAAAEPEEAAAAPEPEKAPPVETPEPEQEASAEVPAEDAPEETAAEAPAEITPPESWTQVEKEQFAGLPAEAQQLVLDKFKSFNSDYTQKTQEIASIRKAMEPHREMIQRSGLTEEQALHHDMTVRQRLTYGTAQERIETVMYLAREAGVLDQMKQSLAPQPQQPAQPVDEDDPDPYVQSQIQKFSAPIQQELQELRQWRDNQQATTREQFVSQLLTTAESMRTAVDGSGNLVYPYFGDVEDDIAALARPYVEQGIIPDLQPLYERAIWSNDSTRNHLLEKRDKEQRERDQANAVAQAEQARRKTVGVRGTTTKPAAAPGNDDDDIRQALLDGWEKAMS